MKSVSWKNAPRVIVVVVVLLAAALRQDWIPDRALYTRLSALIRGESAHPRDHCYPDILRGKKNEKSGESAVYIRRGMSEYGRVGEQGDVLGGFHSVGTDTLGQYARNSATRLSDPHDLTYTEGTTTLQR
ncbi:unnamed protein product [Lasius platythorax]|uniref:Uncharacterized protein n=1 Tax=Lasius platythorax TaxID=488582 RepID=A0AAV2NKY5_9HYME